MIEQITLSVFLGMLAVAAFFLILALPKIIWSWSSLFFRLNHFQWFMHNPFRKYFKDNRSVYPRILYFTNFPLFLAWWCIIYLALIPVRFLNSLYFNVLLFLSVNLRDSFADLLHPRARGFRFLKGKAYYKKWVLDFPVRFLKTVSRITTVLVQALSMFFFDLVWPSLTLFHGTEFESASVKITQSGKWRIGHEDFVGTGIYFALDPKVAGHYSGTTKPSLIVARVTLTMLRPVSTLPEKVRTKAGFGGSGDLISSNAGWFSGALEHWRPDRGGWYEFCLVFPKMKGQFIRSWRIRPICVLPLDKRKGQTGHPERIWNGMSFWPVGKAAVAIFLMTLSLVSAGIYTAAVPDNIFSEVLEFFK